MPLFSFGNPHPFAKGAKGWATRGSGGEILSETDAAGNMLNEYFYFDGKRVGLVSSGSIYYYAEDFLGSSRVMVRANGTLCYDADFTPFGAERVITNSCPQNYKFEGKERDTETGNDDFGAREYSWRFGRWLSSDWSAVPVPVPYANLSNPQTLNLYSMVKDDPESFADLDGHEQNPGQTSSQTQDTTTPCNINDPVTCQSAPPAPAQDQQQGQGTVPPPPPPPNALQKTEYPTVDSAAKAGETRILDTSLQQGVEYGGRIYKNPDSTYSVGTPKTDNSPTSVALPPVSSLPPGTENAGRYHTHPNVPGYDHEHFSPADMRNARNEHVRSYIGTADHKFKRYDPSAPVKP